MKQSVMILALFLSALSCTKSESIAETTSTGEDRVEVLYFYGKQRCPTCLAIENHTKEVIASFLADNTDSSRVIFKAVDISSPEGEAIADKYEVAWSSLFVNCRRDGVESRTDMTEFGFNTALKNPEKFKKGLTEKIQESLK